MKRLALLAVCLLLPGLALSASATTPVEASMVVTGTITVNPDGSVNTYSIHDMDKLPPGARQIIEKSVPSWKFKPVIANGKAVTAETGMSLRLVADEAGAKQWTIRVAGAVFGCEAWTKSHLPEECPADTTVTPIGRGNQPQYPIAALRASLGGEVLLVVQVARDGHVSHVAVQQVDLYRRASDPAPWRKLLADSALRAVRKWQFRVPTMGPNAAKDHWIVHLPVRYTVEGGEAYDRAYGK